MAKDEFEIYCPKCAWRPQPQDRWACEPACGTVWNTFWTRGLCPGCRKLWADTQCLACREFSPHKQWYHRPDRSRSRRTRKRETDTVT
jgi:hypothetical protein